jgi:hypothetical protein
VTDLKVHVLYVLAMFVSFLLHLIPIVGTIIACMVYFAISARGFLILMQFTGKRWLPKSLGLRSSVGNNFGPSFGADSHQNLQRF